MRPFASCDGFDARLLAATFARLRTRARWTDGQSRTWDGQVWGKGRADTLDKTKREEWESDGWGGGGVVGGGHCLRAEHERPRHTKTPLISLSHGHGLGRLKGPARLVVGRGEWRGRAAGRALSPFVIPLTSPPVTVLHSCEAEALWQKEDVGCLARALPVRGQGEGLVARQRPSSPSYAPLAWPVGYWRVR